LNLAIAVQPVSAEPERAAVEAILEARRRRLGADYEPITFSSDWFAACRTLADRINRARHLRRERLSRRESNENDQQATSETGDVVRSGGLTKRTIGAVMGVRDEMLCVAAHLGEHRCSEIRTELDALGPQAYGARPSEAF
jgi:hypothetical protein